MGQAARSASTELILFNSLPQVTRRKLNVTDLKEVTGMILIKDRVQQYYSEDAHKRTTLRRFKRANGYCGGDVWCLAFTGPDKSLCPTCHKHMQNLRNGVVKYKRGVSAYGQLRKRERAEEKAERDRTKGGAAT